MRGRDLHLKLFTGWWCLSKTSPFQASGKSREKGPPRLYWTGEFDPSLIPVLRKQNKTKQNDKCPSTSMWRLHQVLMGAILHLGEHFSSFSVPFPHPCAVHSLQALTFPTTVTPADGMCDLEPGSLAKHPRSRAGQGDCTGQGVQAGLPG